MDRVIKPIRKQNNDDEYKTEDKMRMTAQIYYFKMKEEAPEKYQGKLKKNNERYHSKTKQFEDALKMMKQYNITENLTESVSVN